jgi:hypothetical protein
MDYNALLGLVIAFGAWFGLSVLVIFLFDELKMRHQQRRMANEIRYPRRHREQ